MQNRFVGLSVAIFLILAAYGAGAVEGDAKVTLCRYCNSSAFSNAAETAAMQQAPRLQKGRQFVFVVDVGTDEIRYYEVVREYVQICRENGATARSGVVIDPDDPGPTFPDCFSNWITSSTQLPPPAEAVAELRAAQQDVEKFVAEVQDFDLGELDLGVVPIDSAADLIGESTSSYDTEWVRNTLENAVGDQYFDSWTAILGAALSSLVDRFVNTLLANPSTLNLNRTTVHFPDGTSIDLEITAIVRDFEGRFKGVLVKVDVASARGPGFDPIPATPGAFLMGFANGYAGDPAYLGNLADLVVRGGGRVSRSRSSGSCAAEMQCRDAGVDAEGNPLVECRLDLPKEELEC